MRPIVFLSVLLLATSALAEKEEPRPSVVASATAQVRVAPDRAVVRFGVEHQSTDARAAQSHVNQSMERVMKALRDQKVPAERISTERLELHPVYQHRQRTDGTQGAELVGFRAANVVRVELPVEAGGDRIGAVIDGAIGAGANRVEGISFEIADPEPHRMRALEQAAVQAREKARRMAAALDVRLGELLLLQESGAGGEPPRPFMAMERAALMADTSVSPGELVLSATATVRYAVE